MYLLLATNTGVRLGFLLALTGLFGWMTIMGIIWSMYGIGYKGPAPTWKVLDVNDGNLKDTPVAVAPDVARTERAPEPGRSSWRTASSCRRSSRPAAKVPTLGDLVTTDTELADQLKEQTGRWLLLPSSDKANGETAAAVATELGPDKRNMFARPTDYVILNTFTTGGKPGRTDQSVFGRVSPQAAYRTDAEEPAGLRRRPAAEGHPPGDAKPGQAPPVPAADPNSRVISVIIERDLGALASAVGRLHRRLRHRVRHLRQRAAPAGQGGHAGPGGSRRSEPSRWASTSRSSLCWCSPCCLPR